MIAYASRTGTKRNLDALRRHGWRLLVSARGVHRTEGFRYALDNGAWTSFQKGEPFDERAFWKILVTLGSDADWVALPDKVAAGRESLDLSLSWVDRVLDYTGHALLPVQDGMTPDDIAGVVGKRVGIFVGGSTAWKLDSMSTWAALARDAGCWLHVARVNTRRRIVRCGAVGATSFDGSSASRFSCNVPLLDWSRRQESFLLEALRCPVKGKA